MSKQQLSYEIQLSIFQKTHMQLNLHLTCLTGGCQKKISMQSVALSIIQTSMSFCLYSLASLATVSCNLDGVIVGDGSSRCIPKSVTRKLIIYNINYFNKLLHSFYHYYQDHLWLQWQQGLFGYDGQVGVANALLQPMALSRAHIESLLEA